MPPSFDDIVRIQSFLRASAGAQYQALRIPPFTLFFHPTDPIAYFNYAIPDEPLRGQLDTRAITNAVEQLRAAYLARGRTPRLEFFEAFAPALPAALSAARFEEESRNWCMLCTPESAQPAKPIQGLSVVPIRTDAPEEDVADFIRTQRAGFNPSDQSIPTPEAIESARRDFGENGWTAYLGRMDGDPAGVAVCSRTYQGVCEIAGVATLQAYRGRGIASYLTAQATADAFARGVNTACLSAADERAGRIYQRLGYAPFAILLAYRAIQKQP